MRTCFLAARAFFYAHVFLFFCTCFLKDAAGNFQPHVQKTCQAIFSLGMDGDHTILLYQRKPITQLKKSQHYLHKK